MLREERATLHHDRRATAAHARRIRKVVTLSKCACGKPAVALRGALYLCERCKLTFDAKAAR